MKTHGGEFYVSYCDFVDGVMNGGYMCVRCARWEEEINDFRA